MQNKENLQYLRDYVMELSFRACDVEGAHVVKTGDGPAPAQPKKCEVAAFADGVCITAAAVAALIDTGLPVLDGTEPDVLLTKIIANWIKTREA
ncbi:MAG: hypothetical protein IJ111_13540 [Eggerthellaceae bacterium]|nr:hypothetical protein [Eggerthellaceae bacterium]